MNAIQAVLLGLVQGALEWLPVSSEGINSLLMINFLGKTVSEAVSIALWLHVGTLAAALVYFRKDIKELLLNLKKYKPTSSKKEDRLTTFIVVATLMTGIIGVPIYMIGLENFGMTGKAATAFIGLLLIATGIFMRISKGKAKEKKKETSLDGLITGAAQGLAILPGISRSGFTTSALLLREYDPEKALKLSFLISIPAVLGAQVLLKLNESFVVTPLLLLSAGVSFIVGYLTIDLLLRVGRKIDFSYFVVLIGVLSVLSLLL